MVTDRVRCSINIRCPRPKAQRSKPKPIGNHRQPIGTTATVFGIFGRPLEWLHSPSKPDVSLVPSAIDQEIAIDRPPRVPRGTPALKIGIRLTKKNYEDKMKLLGGLDEQVSFCDIQTVVPKSIIGLQVLGKVELGSAVVCKCYVVDKGCALRDSCPSWFSTDLINSWSGKGVSTGHNVWIK